MNAHMLPYFISWRGCNQAMFACKQMQCMASRSMDCKVMSSNKSTITFLTLKRVYLWVVLFDMQVQLASRRKGNITNLIVQFQPGSLDFDLLWVLNQVIQITFIYRAVIGLSHRGSLTCRQSWLLICPWMTNCT